jgi:hypothetical protein
MLEFLRRLFRRKPKPTEYLGGPYELATKRSIERLPCCGGMRRGHVNFRSGKVLCPQPITGYMKNGKLDLRYHPLEVDEEFEPPWGEPHFPCTTCGCKRGVHVSEGFKRTMCMDPDCPGCPKGCT